MINQGKIQKIGRTNLTRYILIWKGKLLTWISQFINQKTSKDYNYCIPEIKKKGMK